MGPTSHGRYPKLDKGQPGCRIKGGLAFLLTERHQLKAENKKLTIKDIARLAGVSATKVSRVINNARGVCKENKQKVLAIIEKYAYQPNLYAHRLALRSKEESQLQLELFIEDLEKQGMPKHCGVCGRYRLCVKENPDPVCSWIKRYRDWQGDSQDFKVLLDKGNTESLLNPLVKKIY